MGGQIVQASLASRCQAQLVAASRYMRRCGRSYLPSFHNLRCKIQPKRGIVITMMEKRAVLAVAIFDDQSSLADDSEAYQARYQGTLLIMRGRRRRRSFCWDAMRYIVRRCQGEVKLSARDVGMAWT